MDSRVGFLSRMALVGISCLAFVTFLSGCDTNSASRLDKAGARSPRVDRGFPRRIVSATLMTDEVLPHLVDLNRIVAVTAWADLPGTSHVVGRYRPMLPRLASANVEQILMCEPDLVLLSSFNRYETLSLFKTLDIPSLVLPEPVSFEGVRENVRRLGDVVGGAVSATALIRDMDERLRVVSERVRHLPRPRVLFLAGGYTPGRGTLDDAKISAAGGWNVAAEAGAVGHTVLTTEVLVSLRPEILVLPTWPGADPEELIRPFRDHPAWKITPAVQHGRMICLPGGDLSSVSHHAARCVEVLAQAFHP